MSYSYEKLQRDFDAEIQEELERRSKLSVPVRRGQAASLQTAAERMAEAAYRRIKGHRAYALDDTAKLEFAALALAARQSKKNLVDVLDVLSKVVVTLKDHAGKVTHYSLGLLQKRPADDAGTIPELPIDKVTGLRVRNPWEKLVKHKPTDPEYDYKSQHMIRETSERWAEFLADCAKFGGPTMAMLDQLEYERIEAEHLRKIKYSDEEWAQNKLRKDIEPNVTLRMQFEKSIADPWLAKFHRQEVEAGSPRLKFDNHTICSSIRDRSPEIREIHKAAGEIFRGWQQEAEQKAVAA